MRFAGGRVRNVDRSLAAHLCRCTGWLTVREAIAGAHNPPRDWEPAGAAAQMSGQRAIDVPHAPAREAHDDSWRAEATLRAAGRDEGSRERVPKIARQAFDRRHCPTHDPRHRRYAGDAGLAVDEHCAASALTLRSATVLGRGDPEPFPQHVQERLTRFGFDGNGDAVAREFDAVHGMPVGASATAESVWPGASG